MLSQNVYFRQVYFRYEFNKYSYATPIKRILVFNSVRLLINMKRISAENQGFYIASIPAKFLCPFGEYCRYMNDSPQTCMGLVNFNYKLQSNKALNNLEKFERVKGLPFENLLIIKGDKVK